LDEITLFRGLRPQDPPDTDQMRAAVRQRLAGEIGRPARRAPRPGWFRRRPLLLATAAVAVAACAAIVVPAVLPGGGAGPLTSGAAWAVERHDDGTIEVSISQAYDAAGLQRRLRADGVLAYVRFSRWIFRSSNGSVTSYPAEECGQAGPSRVHLPGNVTAAVFPFVKNTTDFSYAFNIRPSAIPKGAAVLIEVTANGPTGQAPGGFDIGTEVLANDLPPACTPAH